MAIVTVSVIVYKLNEDDIKLSMNEVIKQEQSKVEPLTFLDPATTYPNLAFPLPPRPASLPVLEALFRDTYLSMVHPGL